MRGLQGRYRTCQIRWKPLSGLETLGEFWRSKRPNASMRFRRQLYGPTIERPVLSSRARHPRRQAQPERSGASQRRPINWRRRLLIVLFMLAALTVIGLALVWQRAAAFNDAVSNQEAMTSRLFGRLDGDEQVNILLIGYSNPDRDGAFLSDSLTLLSINPPDGATTAISVPRDLWLEEVPAVPGNGKVNEAFALGYSEGGLFEGGRRSSEAVAAITGLHIDGWLALNFDGFRAMVEAVGGVTVDNPQGFSYARDDAEREGLEPYSGHFAAGPIVLDAQAALEYAQARYTDVPAESSDFARNARQRRLVAAIIEKLGSGLPAIPSAFALADALTDRLTTDMSVIDLFLLSKHLSPDHQIELTDATILSATRNSVGQYVLVVTGAQSPSDYDPLKAYIATNLAAIRSVDEPSR